MRQLPVLIILLGLAFFSCKKNSAPIDPELSGSWKMISVTDNLTDTVITKPANTYVDINMIIIFTSSAAGNISVSLTQSSIKGNFTIGQNKTISIPKILISYPGFDIFYGSLDWDNEFLDNLSSSSLKYFFDSNSNLNISNSNTNKTVTFVKQ
jgi:hypothetical protein